MESESNRLDSIPSNKLVLLCSCVSISSTFLGWLFHWFRVVAYLAIKFIFFFVFFGNFSSFSQRYVEAQCCVASHAYKGSSLFLCGMPMPTIDEIRLLVLFV